MKHLLLTLILSTLLFSSEYGVQVIAVKNPDSLTPSFMRIAKSLESQKVSYKILNEGVYQKVVFKTFQTKKDALLFCKIAREKVAKDAFIRPVTQEKEKIKQVSGVKDTTHKLIVQKSLSKKEKRLNELDAIMDFYAHSKYYTFSCKKW